MGVPRTAAATVPTAIPGGTSGLPTSFRTQEGVRAAAPKLAARAGQAARAAATVAAPARARAVAGVAAAARREPLAGNARGALQVLPSPRASQAAARAAGARATAEAKAAEAAPGGAGLEAHAATVRGRRDAAARPLVPLEARAEASVPRLLRHAAPRAAEVPEAVRATVAPRPLLPAVLVVATTVHDVQGVPSPDVATFQVPTPTVPALEVLRRAPHAAVLARGATGAHPAVQTVPAPVLSVAGPVGRPANRQGATAWPLALLHAAPKPATVLVEDLAGVPAQAQTLQEPAVRTTPTPIVATMPVAAQEAAAAAAEASEAGMRPRRAPTKERVEVPATA